MKKKGQGSRKTSNYWLLLIAILSLSMFLHFKIEDFFLKFFGVCTQAVVTDELGYHRGKPPTYRFFFYVNGERFSGDSRMFESSSKNDTIPVVYLKAFPIINRSIETYFDGNFECR